MVRKRYGSSQHEKRIAPNKIFTKPLTKKQREELKALARLPDSAIDYSDAPTTAKPVRLFVGRFYRPVKKLVSVRIDADVLDWVKSQGERYQTRMNQVLRREMESRQN